MVPRPTGPASASWRWQRPCPGRRCGLRRRGGSGSDGGTTITVSHGYTDVEADRDQGAGRAVEQGPPRRRRSSWSSTAATTARCRRRSPGSPPATTPTSPTSSAPRRPQLARQPKLVDLTDEVKDADFNWDDFYPSEREAATVDGKVVGIPALVDNLRLVYNKKLFEAGRRRRCRPTTGRGTTSAPQRRSSPTRSTKTYGWAYVNDGSEDTVWRYLALLWQAGGELLNADNTKPAFDSDAGLQALDAAAGHGGHGQVGLPRHRQRQLPEPVQQRQDRDAVDRARGTCPASTTTSTTA